MNARHIACLLGLGLGGCMSCASSSDSLEDSAASTTDSPEPDDTGVIEPKRCADDRTWVQVSAGEVQTCGLHGDGCIECWGSAYQGELNVPDSGGRIDRVDFGDDEPPNGAYTYVAVAQGGGGSNHACALDAKGRVSCWGRDDSGQSSPSAGAFSFLSLHNGYSCGIRADTTIECWGAWWGDGAGVPTESGFVSMHAGSSGRSCAVNIDGYVSCWQQDARSADKIGSFSSVGVGYWVCAGGLDEPITCWNESSGEAVDVEGVPVAPGFVDVCQSSYSGYYGCALADDGHVECWDGESHVPPETLFSQISCGSQHTCGVTLDGAIECWGSCNGGECDPPP